MRGKDGKGESVPLCSILMVEAIWDFWHRNREVDIEYKLIKYRLIRKLIRTQRDIHSDTNPSLFLSFWDGNREWK